MRKVIMDQESRAALLSELRAYPQIAIVCLQQVKAAAI
jgi:hypothetical protein